MPIETRSNEKKSRKNKKFCFVKCSNLNMRLFAQKYAFNKTGLLPQSYFIIKRMLPNCDQKKDSSWRALSKLTGLEDLTGRTRDLAN